MTPIESHICTCTHKLEGDYGAEACKGKLREGSIAFLKVHTFK